MLKIIRLEQTDSTNSFISRNIADLEADTVVCADCQSAGRGQRGNSWEAEPFRNLTFSILLCPKNFPAIRQFAISEAVALAIVRAVKQLCAVELKIKWPNDIYYNNKKICGILIEHAVMGKEILHTIIGIGLNVNQQKFVSDAPNPVSLYQISGSETDLDSLLHKISTDIINLIPEITLCDKFNELHSEYMLNLWRGDGREYVFRDTASGQIFPGIVSHIEPTGHLNVKDTSTGDYRRFAFKEVEWVI